MVWLTIVFLSICRSDQLSPTVWRRAPVARWRAAAGRGAPNGCSAWVPPPRLGVPRQTLNDPDLTATEMSDTFQPNQRKCDADRTGHCQRCCERRRLCRRFAGRRRCFAGCRCYSLNNLCKWRAEENGPSCLVPPRCARLNDTSPILADSCRANGSNSFNFLFMAFFLGRRRCT